MAKIIEELTFKLESKKIPSTKVSFRQKLIDWFTIKHANGNDLYHLKKSSKEKNFNVEEYVPIDVTKPTFELNDCPIQQFQVCYDNLLPNDPQSRYWFVFKSQSVKIEYSQENSTGYPRQRQYNYIYYVINLHPEPTNLYAVIDNNGVHYLKIRQHLVLSDHRMIPKINWLIPIDQIEIPKLRNTITPLHDAIIKALTVNTVTKKSLRIHAASQVCYKIPSDVVQPNLTNDSIDSIELIASGYVFNVDYGSGRVVNKKHHSQYKYWYPFLYDYDCPMQIYLINLHPEPDFLYGVRTIYRSTDYSSGYEGDFKKIAYNDIVEKFDTEAVPII